MPTVYSIIDLELVVKIEIYYHDKPPVKIPVYKLTEIKPDTIIINRGRKQYLVKEL